MLSSSLIPEPDIIASIGQHERWTLLRMVHDPTISAVYYSMLEKYRWRSRSRKFMFNSINMEHVSIIRRCYMVFEIIVITFNDFLKGHIEFFIYNLPL